MTVSVEIIRTMSLKCQNSDWIQLRFVWQLPRFYVQVEVAFLRRPSEHSPYLLMKYLVVVNRLLRVFSVWASMGPLIVLRDQVDCPSGTAVEDQAWIPISRANQSSQLDTYLRIQVMTCSGREISKVFSQEVKHILSHWSKWSAIPLTKKVR